MYFIFCTLFIFGALSVFSSYGKMFRSFVSVNVYCVGARIPTLMYISDGLDSYLFLGRWKTRGL